MKKEAKAKIIAWTYAIQRLQKQAQNLQEQAQNLNEKRLELVEQETGENINSIDISNVNLETFEGEIKT